MLMDYRQDTFARRQTSQQLMRHSIKVLTTEQLRQLYDDHPSPGLSLIIIEEIKRRGELPLFAKHAATSI